MLLFTWTGLMNTTTDLFQWFFHVMDSPNRNMNIMFIVIGAIGAIYWLTKQNKYNAEAEQNGTFK
ncbi:MAG: hypothetical protein AABZ32_00785 [Bacteroidota bacterium]